MLSVNSLQLHRGGKAVLHGISLRVPPGEVTALLGANGAGKSSTVMAIAGALPVSGGRIEVEGQALHNTRPERVRGLGVAVVPEPVTALALDGVAYRPLSGAGARVELAVAHRADRSEPHLERTVGIIRAMF